MYEVIVEEARKRGLAGATVLRGVLGFGAHSRINREDPAALRRPPDGDRDRRHGRANRGLRPGPGQMDRRGNGHSGKGASDCLPASRGQALRMRRTVAGRSIGSLLCASLLVWSLVAAAGFVAENGAAPQRLHIAGLDVAAWLPSRDTPGPCRLLFSRMAFTAVTRNPFFLWRG